MKKIVMFAFLIILFSSFVFASTVTFDKEIYSPTNEIEVDMVIEDANEKGKAYILLWYNGTNYNVANSTGTTPTDLNEHFTASYIIPADYNSTINATLTGTNLEGFDNATVTPASSSEILISNAVFGGGFLGLTSSIKVTVKDENDKKLSGGSCKFSVWSNYGPQKRHSPCLMKSQALK